MDVPCNTDRHVLISEDNNLFKPGRMEERLELPTEQMELLVYEQFLLLHCSIIPLFGLSVLTCIFKLPDTRYVIWYT